MTVLNQQSSLTKSKSLVLGAYRKWVQTVQWDAGAKKKKPPTKKKQYFLSILLGSLARFEN